MNNSKLNVCCRSRVWFAQDNPRNKALQVPEDAQLNQVGKIATVIAALKVIPPYQPVRIHINSKYIIEGLTSHLESWGDNRWIDIKNAKHFRKVVHLIRHRSVRTTLHWVKGHDSVQENKGSDALAKQGANKDCPDPMNLEIPDKFDI
jgi:ribonuclease HI